MEVLEESVVMLLNKLLEGNEIIVVNSEKSVISGNKKILFKDMVQWSQEEEKLKKDLIYIKLPYRMLKRGIRGMLPDYRKGMGKQAFLKIKCHNGIPEEFKDKAKEMKKFKDLGIINLSH